MDQMRAGPTGDCARLEPSINLKVYGHLMKGALAEAVELYDPLERMPSQSLVHRAVDQR